MLVAVITLHSANADTCQLPYTSATNGVAATGLFSVLTEPIVANTCAVSCGICGQIVGALPTGTFANGLDTAAEMVALGNAICPQLTYTMTVATGDSLPLFGVPALAATSIVLTSTGVSTKGDVAYALTAPTTTTQVVCPCVANAAGNLCSVCGCTDLGVPTAAPTTAPTTAPTVATNSPTDSVNYDFTSDDLSAGDIAGIVIGAVGGSFLFLLIGVLVGGMVGGKSSAPAAPAGQL